MGKGCRWVCPTVGTSIGVASAVGTGIGEGTSIGAIVGEPGITISTVVDGALGGKVGGLGGGDRGRLGGGHGAVGVGHEVLGRGRGHASKDNLRGWSCLLELVIIPHLVKKDDIFPYASIMMNMGKYASIWLV